MLRYLSAPGLTVDQDEAVEQGLIKPWQGGGGRLWGRNSQRRRDLALKVDLHDLLYFVWEEAISRK